MKNSTLTGGDAKVGEIAVPGTFTWKSPDTAPSVSDSSKTAYLVTFTPTDSKNYATAECSVKVTVNKTDSEVKIAPSAKTLSYNGQAQELVTAGSTETGTLQYAIGTDATTAPTASWSTSIPTATDIGTYYVWYKVVGDENHDDSEPKVITATISNYVYRITTDNQEWQKGSSGGLTLTFKCSYADELTYDKWNKKVVIDGKEIASSSYEAKSGSLVITLKPAYLETLSTGKHTMNITFTDGSASATFTIKAKSSDGGSSTPEKKTDNVVTCQMAGYPSNYAWNEAAKACQPGYIDANGVFRSTASASSVPNTYDEGVVGDAASLLIAMIAATIASYLLKKH